jgi:geranylgeranyl reductase family protein
VSARRRASRVAGRYDVIVVGGGPAGATMGWALAGRGVGVAVLERARFPREKVCGDYVEPGGLRLLDAMGCLDALPDPAPISATRVYFGPNEVFAGDIPYYEGAHRAPPHGRIVPRHVLDTQILERAAQASAVVRQDCAVEAVRREDGLVRIQVREGGRAGEIAAPIVVGADGTESIVARSFGGRRADRRYMGLSQRAYVEGVETPGGEAVVWFDDDIYPGYGWLFPMPGGRANVGVGILGETCQRQGLSVPDAFALFLKKLKLRHPGCAGLRLASRPLGGVVKTYAAIDHNHFDGGILIGDAGSFVDPITGEGITQGMESALIGASSVMDALEAGRFDAGFLQRFEDDFRGYFDPSMRFLTLCASIMRNWHLRDFWFRATRRGFEEAKADPTFAGLAGSIFGGPTLRPLAVVEQIWAKIFRYLGADGVRMAGELLGLRGFAPRGLAADLGALQRGMRSSLSDDPRWHFSWAGDVLKSAAAVQSTLWTSGNPRMLGPLD